MTETPEPPNRPGDSFAQHELQARINRVESSAAGLMGLGGLLLLIGFLLALFGKSFLFLLIGGFLFLAGRIESVRAEILKLHAKLEKD